MNKIITLITLFISFSLFAQDDINEKVKPIVAEGKLLYKSEMASWYGTDLFLEKYTKRENIGGYFSYTEKETSKCIFFSKSDNPKVIGTISFDSTYNMANAKADLSERNFSKNENDLFLLRKNALAEINSDTLFKTYKNTSLNLIPLINGKVKKVYVLTGPQKTGIVIFGNDYLLTFDKNNKIISKKQLHKNIIPIESGENLGEGKEIEGTMHNHLPETGDFITATDVCTLMLYGKFTNWKTHNVVSQKYLNIWDCKKNELFVMEMEAVKKIVEEEEKEKEKEKK